MTEPFEALAALTRALEGQPWSWCLFGAHALAVRADPRATKDIDVTIQVAESELDALIASLETSGFRTRPADAREFARRYAVLPVVHDPSGVPVDLVIAGTQAELAALGRATDESYLGVRLPVMSAEDLVIFKLSSERQRDYEDARTLIASRASSLDVELIREALRERERLFDRSDLVAELDRLIERYRRR